MKTLIKNTKIAILFSLVAACLAFAGCASKNKEHHQALSSTDNSTVVTSSTVATTETTPVTTTTTTTTSDQGTTVASTNTGINGQQPITWDQLQALQALGAFSGTAAPVAPQTNSSGQ